MKTITDLPLLFLDLLKPKRFVRQDLGDIDEITMPFDLTVVSHLPHNGVGIVLYRRDFPWVNPCRGIINTSWSFSSQRFMRTLVIVLVQEQIKVVLLAWVSWLRCNVIFKGSVHAFMAPILAGLTRLNPFRADAQLNPPLRQLTDPTDSQRGKGCTVVSADGLRQSILPKRPLQPGPDRGITRMFQSAAQQQITGEVVRECQR